MLTKCVFSVTTDDTDSGGENSTSPSGTTSGGMNNSAGRLRALGNGVIPGVIALHTLISFLHRVFAFV